MKRDDSRGTFFALLLLTAMITAVSGCGGSDKVHAQSPSAITTPISAMIYGYSSIGPGTGSISTAFLQERVGDPANQDFSSMPMPSNAVLGHLHFISSSTLTSATAVVSVYVNGIPSAVTCNIGPGVAAPVTCSDTTHTVMVNEGDLVNIGATVAPGSGGSGTLGAFRASAGITFQ